MVLQDEDAGNTGEVERRMHVSCIDAVERRRCSWWHRGRKDVDAMLQKYKLMAVLGPMSEVELWTLLESVNSVAKSSEGVTNTAAEIRRQKLAANLRARRLCAEAQAQLVGADGSRAREIVKDLDNKLTALSYI